MVIAGAALDREMRAARAAPAEAARAWLPDGRDVHVDMLRDELEIERRTACEATDGDGRAVLPGERLRAESLETRRDGPLAPRKDGDIGGDAFHLLEEDFDDADLAVATRS